MAMMKYYTSIGFIATLMVGSTMALASPRKVVVTGAGGQTGQSLFRKLLALKEEFEPLGLVRSEESKAALVESGVPASRIAVVDVTDAASVKAVAKDCAAFCICTSAKPSPTGEVMPETGRPIFGFPNGSPELVDWMGQKNQIDACPAGAHVVVCSTMGGTDVNHPLNNLGRTVNEDGSISGGNIVKWKRKSEVYLMSKSDLKYTIIHPGGLLNEPGGERELIVGVDDTTTLTDAQTVPRQDVAEVMLQALRYPESYAGRSFDLRAKPVGDGSTTTNFETLIESLEGKNCDYSLGETM
jgi:uncharacterized protein YbjT (DUF2867 family)